MRTSNSSEIAAKLVLPEYPRSSSYDVDWLMKNMMGPNPLWLIEGLAKVMEIPSDAFILDLGCGKAVTSIFLAKEYGSFVEAVDLWIAMDDNRRRIDEAQVSDRVHAVHGDAMNLPFGDDHFDLIVSMDAYHYFGTGKDALPAVLKVLRPGGRIGIVVPGLTHEVETWPKDLAPWWEDGFETFHSPEWWRELWEESRLVRIERAELVPGGSQQWLTWAYAADEWAVAQGREPYRREVAMLEADKQRFLGFSRIIATKL